MKLKLDKNKATNLYIQVYEEIRDKILSEELAFGSRLLSERKLSQLLDVNRQTIATAYELLKVDGLIESFSGRGTFVSYKQEEKKHKKTINTYLNWPELFERKQRVRHGSLIELIMDEQLKKDTYFLAGGLPATEAVPKEAFRQISSELLQDKHLNVLSQSPVSGVSQLKKQIKQIMWHRGYESKVDEYLITSGSQQALDLIFRAFLQPGDTVLIEEPSFFGVIELLKHYGAHIVSLPMDKEGMQTSILEYMLEKHRPKFIYTIPTYQNPTAISMSIERRKALIALSNKYNVGIIEDDPYGALQYEGKHYPTLKSMDKSNHVIYVSTFSKTVSLGLRIGWITAAEEVINQLVKVKQISDLHVNTFNQYTLAAFIESGQYFEHEKKLIKEYSLKRDIMLKTLKEEIGEVEYIYPDGGFYVWISLDEQVSSRALFDEGIKHGLLITPGYHFMKDGKERGSFIRLNFTYPHADDIVAGIKVLAACYRKIKEKRGEES
jgi:DNA-binding transcriptional MocR family regulator